jgi:glycosyltransferase involved in cell wall biosynthesis
MQKANGHVCAVVDLACTQVKQGHQVLVCSRGGGFVPKLLEYGVEHITISQERKFLTLISALYKIFKMIRKFKPEIVHAHMVTSALLVAILHPFMSFRYITTVHNEFQRSAILMRFADRIIAVSDNVRQSMIRRGIPANKLRTVLNGTVNSPRFSKPPPPPLALQRPAIVFVGGLHPRKGVDDLINSFVEVLSVHPNAHLYIIGEGPFREEYENLAISISDSGIVFCGYLDDPRPYLLGTDIFVLASLAEPAGLVITEARECGCAIVATNVGGIPELLDHGLAGILVPPKQPAFLAKTLLNLLANPAYLAEMREKSRANIFRFTVERVATETEQVYKELLSNI